MSNVQNTVSNNFSQLLAVLYVLKNEKSTFVRSITMLTIFADWYWFYIYDR